jgi:hypothetical protein
MKEEYIFHRENYTGKEKKWKTGTYSLPESSEISYQPLVLTVPNTKIKQGSSTTYMNLL